MSSRSYLQKQRAVATALVCCWGQICSYLPGGQP